VPCEAETEFAFPRFDILMVYTLKAYSTRPQPSRVLALEQLGQRRQSKREQHRSISPPHPAFFLTAGTMWDLYRAMLKSEILFCFFDSSNVIAVLRWSRDRHLLVGRAVVLKLRSGLFCSTRGGVDQVLYEFTYYILA